MHKLAPIEPSSRDVLKVIGITTIVIGSMIVPGLPKAVKPVLDIYRDFKRLREVEEFGKYNQSRLRQILKRLYEQKIIEIFEENSKVSIKLTEKGKTRLLRYDLENIELDKSQKWDMVWRLIIYDVGKQKRLSSEVFRRLLKKMKFLRLQKSVYLTPFPCKNEIEYLRQVYGLGREVLYIEARSLENEEVYRNYFKV